MPCAVMSSSVVRQYKRRLEFQVRPHRYPFPPLSYAKDALRELEKCLPQHAAACRVVPMHGRFRQSHGPMGYCQCTTRHNLKSKLAARSAHSNSLIATATRHSAAWARSYSSCGIPATPGPAGTCEHVFGVAKRRSPVVATVGDCQESAVLRLEVAALHMRRHDQRKPVVMETQAKFGFLQHILPVISGYSQYL